MTTRKSNSIVFIFLLLSFPILAQTAANMLTISEVNQNDPSWCWAASIEMIMKNKYPLAPNTSQCDIAKAKLNCSTLSCPLDNSCDGSPTCSRTSDIKGIKDVFNSFFKKKINSKSYLSFLWDSVKREIDNNRPFIIAINETSTSPCKNYTHFVVAKGYSESSSSNLMIVNDPGGLCSTGSAILGVIYKDFGTDADASAKPCTFIYLMNHRDNIEGEVHVQSTTDTAASVAFSARSIIAPPPMFTITKRLSNTQMNKLVASGQFQRVPVHYYADIDGKIDSSRNLVDMIQTDGEKNIATRMQFINGKWEPLLVMKQNDGLVVPFSFRGKEFNLNNNKKLSDRSVQDLKYEKVIVPPYFYEYYRFSLDGGKNYLYTLAHVNQAFLGGFSVKKGDVLTEREFRSIIKKTALSTSGLPQSPKSPQSKTQQVTPKTTKTKAPKTPIKKQ